jgi:ABC-type polysaccharide/polyol phosphate export permease
MAIMASSAIIYIAISKISITSRKENLVAKIIQILMGAIVALVVVVGLTWMADGLVGINIPQFTDTALFLSITSFSFFLMISAVLSLLGIKGIPVFVLLLFFGGPLLAMAPEMMCSFYQDWFYPWLPMRFMVEGLRELFFFGKGLTWSSPVSTLVWIGLVSMVIILGSALKLNSVKDKASNQRLVN